ncbi:MAG: double zinc ribbon domain-containing protein [Myxococcota bacterium]
MLRALLDDVLDAIWPLHCAACDLPTRDGVLCEGCLATLVPGTGDGCPRCGVVWLDPVPGGGDHVCGTCLRDPPPWTRARAAWAYGGALRDVVTRWKNAPDHTLGPWLGDLLVAGADGAGWRDGPRDRLVVPVPSHSRRLRGRGFNPAGILASRLAADLDLALAPTALRARKPAPPSKGMGRKARQRRLVGVFRGDRRGLGNRSVLLVDDVMTTGATARAATKACLRAGAREVEVAVLARVGR